MSENRSILKRRLPQSLWFVVWLVLVVSLFCAITKQAHAAEPGFVATPVGAPITLFDPRRDACDGHDVPDAPLRAYRGVDGTLHAFGLHYENRRMSGTSLLALKIECAIVFRGTGDGDPKKFDDRAWITAIWTPDGNTVHALAHHEFQAHRHEGRCAFPGYMKCWWNSILTLQSEDGGQNFRRIEPLVVAATPFPSEQGQGRHRGFFNPSNILERDGFLYTMIGTTGWDAAPASPGSPARTRQEAGVCLFRATSSKPEGWRGFDGKDFTARFPDPYGPTLPLLQRCTVLAPFPAPVGAFVRHRPSGRYLAIFQAKTGMADGFGGFYPQSGFYVAASRDLVHWQRPTLVLATKTLYDEACDANFQRSYPVLIDEAAEGRNFEDIGNAPLLTYSEMRVEGCKGTSDRRLIARKVRISTFIRE